MTAAAMCRWTCAALLLAGGPAGCGNDRSRARTPGAARGSPTATAVPSPAASPASRADERVIRRWADALRRGDVEEAARWFAIPSLVSNGTPAIRLTSRGDVRFFNRTLPCGARLVRTEQHGRLILATFRLTERPGAGRCGAGVGQRARTAFLIRRGRIAEWIRVTDAEPPDEPTGPET